MPKTIETKPERLTCSYSECGAEIVPGKQYLSGTWRGRYEGVPAPSGLTYCDPRCAEMEARKTQRATGSCKLCGRQVSKDELVAVKAGRPRQYCSADCRNRWIASCRRGYKLAIKAVIPPLPESGASSAAWYKYADALQTASNDMHHALLDSKEAAAAGEGRRDPAIASSVYGFRLRLIEQYKRAQDGIRRAEGEEKAAELQKQWQKAVRDGRAAHAAATEVLLNKHLASLPAPVGSDVSDAELGVW